MVNVNILLYAEIYLTGSFLIAYIAVRYSPLYYGLLSVLVSALRVICTDYRYSKNEHIGGPIYRYTSICYRTNFICMVTLQ